MNANSWTQVNLVGLHLAPTTQSCRMRTGGRRFADMDVLAGMEGENENMARGRAGSCVEFHNVKVRVFSAFNKGGFLPSCLESVLYASLAHTPPLVKKTLKRSMKVSHHTLLTKLVNPSLCLCWIRGSKSDFVVIGTWWAAVGGSESCCQMLFDCSWNVFTNITVKQQVCAFVAAGK